LPAAGLAERAAGLRAFGRAADLAWGRVLDDAAFADLVLAGLAFVDLDLGMNFKVNS
jgi:hypothetical protein